jgi:hypothetical protein
MAHEVIDSGVYKSSRAYEQQQQWREVFCQVILAYRDVLSLSPLVACSYDPETRSRRLGPDPVLYKIDIEQSTDKALKNNPELIKKWEQFAFDDAEDFKFSHVSPAMIRDCARIYQARKLQPQIYLKKIRKGRPDRRSAKPVEAAA